MRIGVIGTGTIASAVVKGIANDGHQIVVSNRNHENAEALAAAYASVTVAENQDVLDAVDVVFLGTTDVIARRVLPDLKFRQDHVVISLMAGPTLPEIAALVAPANADALMIPFPFIAQGQSPILCYPASNVVQQLFGGTNSVLAVSSMAQMHSYLSAQALLSPVLTMLGQSAAWLGSQTGDHPADHLKAEKFLRLLIGGSLLADPLDTPGVVASLIADLDTPGGYNAQLRNHMAQQGTYDALTQGLDLLSSGSQETQK